MCVFLSASGPSGRGATVNSHNTQHQAGGKQGGEEAGHAGFNQSLHPIELQCVLVQWPTPD